MVINENKSYKIQVLRGIAIIAVVSIHNTPAGLYQVFCRPFFNWAVGFFLFLSGMLTRAAYLKKWKRIVKLLVPYCLWSFVYVLIDNWRKPFFEFLLVFFQSLLFGKAAAVMYFVFVYIQVVLLVPMIEKMAHSKFWVLGFLVSPIELFFMRFIPIVFNIRIGLLLSSIMKVSCIGWFSYFYLGYMIGNGYLPDTIEERITHNNKLLWVGGGCVSNPSDY